MTWAAGETVVTWEDGRGAAPSEESWLPPASLSGEGTTSTGVGHCCTACDASHLRLATLFLLNTSDA